MIQKKKNYWIDFNFVHWMETRWPHRGIGVQNPNFVEFDQTVITESKQGAIDI